MLLIFLFPCISFAQKIDSVAFKGANKIVITTNTKSTEGLKIALLALQDNGFSIELANTELGILKTEPKTYGTSGVLIVDVTAEENKVTLRTRIRSTMFYGTELDLGNPKQLTYEPYTNRKAVRKGYEILDKVAKSMRLPYVYSN